MAKEAKIRVGLCAIAAAALLSGCSIVNDAECGSEGTLQLVRSIIQRQAATGNSSVGYANLKSIAPDELSRFESPRLL